MSNIKSPLILAKPPPSPNTDKESPSLNPFILAPPIN